MRSQTRAFVPTSVSYIQDLHDIQKITEICSLQIFRTSNPEGTTSLSR
ncbi:MAG TPA: hypothetical protein ACFCUD_15155 [Cyclobacteriaceae bacterium]